MATTQLKKSKSSAIVKIKKGRPINFNRDMSAATPREKAAWTFLLQESGDDPSDPWNGFVSRVILSKNGSPSDITHYDVAFKFRASSTDKFQLALALSDHKGGFKTGVRIADHRFLGKLFQMIGGDSNGYKAIRVEVDASLQINMFYTGNHYSGVS